MSLTTDIQIERERRQFTSEKDKEVEAWLESARVHKAFDAIFKRRGEKVLIDWAGEEELLSLFDFYLREGFYTSARFFADALLEQGIPIESIRFKAGSYFEDLGYRKNTSERIKLAMLFEEPYLFHKWLDVPETRIYNRLRPGVNVTHGTRFMGRGVFNHKLNK